MKRNLMQVKPLIMKLRKKSKKTQGTSKKDTDGQPCTGVTRGERTH